MIKKVLCRVSLLSGLDLPSSLPIAQGRNKVHIPKIVSLGGEGGWLNIRIRRELSLPNGYIEDPRAVFSALGQALKLYSHSGDLSDIPPKIGNFNIRLGDEAEVDGDTLVIPMNIGGFKTRNVIYAFRTEAPAYYPLEGEWAWEIVRRCVGGILVDTPYARERFPELFLPYLDEAPSRASDRYIVAHSLVERGRWRHHTLLIAFRRR